MSKDGRDGEEAVLRVESAYQDDVGMNRARVAQSVIRGLNINPGDVVRIRGERGLGETACVVWKLRDERGEGVDIVRIDGITRSNASVSVGDRVYISPLKPQGAKRVIMAPISERPPRMFELFKNEDVKSYIRRELQKRPVKAGDVIAIPKIALVGGAMYFKVLKTSPKGFVTIELETDLEVRIVTKEELEAGVGGQVSYEDIGGLRGEVERVREMIELPLRHPELFAQLGIQPPKGVLLYGPPGTGKTLIARAVASDSGAHFIAIQGPEIMSKYYGESEAHLRKIFDDARRKAPSIIFIDELDSIAPRRDDVKGEVERRVVAQLLTLMDGLNSRGKVVVIGATNRIDGIDPALRRPGRFDREIMIGVPDREARKEILTIHTRGMPLHSDVDLEHIADVTPGFVGADLEAVVKEAAMKALRRYMPDMDLEGEVPHTVLKNMVVKGEDFAQALNEIEPSAMRAVLVEMPKVSWDMVGGLDDIKTTLQECVELPLKDPERFRRMGIRPPKGILLYGPPGTGKTLMVKAIASQTTANFISVKGPEIMSKWVGESEKAVREIFKRARMVAPCIVFIDEIDAIAPRRSVASDTRVTERVVNQMLTSIDGMEGMDGVVVIAATNRPDILDPALLRSGRFDVMIYVPIPDLKARESILAVHTRNMPLAGDVDLGVIADATDNYVGSDIENLCREAAMKALRDGRDAVCMEDFYSALEIVRPSVTEGMRNYYENLKNELVGNINRATVIERHIMDGYT